MKIIVGAGEHIRVFTEQDGSFRLRGEIFAGVTQGINELEKEVHNARVVQANLHRVAVVSKALNCITTGAAEQSAYRQGLLLGLAGKYDSSPWVGSSFVGVNDKAVRERFSEDKHAPLSMADLGKQPPRSVILKFGDGWADGFMLCEFSQGERFGATAQSLPMETLTEEQVTELGKHKQLTLF